MLWKTKGVSKENVQQLGTGELTGCFASFLQNYEADSSEMYLKVKQMMKEVFKKKRIYGALVVDAGEDVEQVFFNVLMKALAEVTDENAFVFTEMLAMKFIRLANQ